MPVCAMPAGASLARASTVVYIVWEHPNLMAELTWEKNAAVPNAAQQGRHSRERLKFLIGGAIILAAIAFLILSETAGSARFFITVDEVVSNPAYVGQTVRLTGAVIGETIEYDSRNGIIRFTIAHLPSETPNLGEALHIAANDASATRVEVFIENQVKPDLLQHEAQAILTGTLGEDGVFHATELLLKCPSRFEEANPGSMISSQQG